MKRFGLGLVVALFKVALATTSPAASEVSAAQSFDCEQSMLEIRPDKTLHLRVAGEPVQRGSRAGLAWLRDVEFDEGTIEVELKGRASPPQHSFLGIAFHGIDAKNLEAVYFRPFNFNAPDPQKSRAVQYISWPDHTWERLREQHPGVYEKPIVPAPDPERWFHVRIDLSARQVRVFVEHAVTPTLVVERLSTRTGGKVGLFVDVYDGEFRELSIRPR